MNITFFSKIFTLELLKKVNINTNSKKKNFFYTIGIVFSLFSLIFHALLIIAIIFINKVFTNTNDIQVILFPINLITYIIGNSLVLPVVVINLIIKKIKDKKNG
ncbi:hypothetical protein [Mycoplasma sp. CB776]